MKCRTRTFYTDSQKAGERGDVPWIAVERTARRVVRRLEPQAGSIRALRELCR